MSEPNGKAAVFALTRGYDGVHKFKYARLLLRNRALRRLVGTEAADFILFHEGNISLREQQALALLSGLPLRFVNVAAVYRLGAHQVWTGASDFSMGYSLMCRFNYEHVWKYLSEYEVVCRVDEDVVVTSFPTMDFDSDMLVGCLSDECHEKTNATLPVKLDAMGLAQFYDHRFPYTNCYVTRMNFWRRPEVQQFVQCIGEDATSIENRWGDLPVIGVALQSFGAWNPEVSVDRRISYLHGSHRSSVQGGRLVWPDSALKHKELGWIAWALASLDTFASWKRVIVNLKRPGAVRRIRSLLLAR
jgi:hypothetical protein